MNTNRVRVLLQNGYVLHRRPYRDSSLLVELFTPHHGRVGVIARGARQPKSRLHGVLQPFRPLMLSWSGSGELPGLTAAESDGMVPWLTGQALMGGFYLNELMMRLLQRHDPHAELYAAYHSTVTVLSNIDTSADDAQQVLERALRLFEKQLLEEIGYGLVLDHDVEQGCPIESQQLYLYHLTQGPVPVSNLEAARSHHVVLRGQSLLDLNRGELHDDVSLREAKRLIRAALAEHLGAKPLASRQLFRKDGIEDRGSRIGQERDFLDPRSSIPDPAS